MKKEERVCLLFIKRQRVRLDCCYGYVFKDKPADREARL